MFRETIEVVVTEKLVGQYLGRKGLGCIIAADYAREHDAAGMLGYVQSETCDAWVHKIEGSLLED
jgi:hypothetical protein